MKLVVVFLTGILLFLMLSFLKKVLEKAGDQNHWVAKAVIYLPYVEFFMWVVYYFWAIDRIFLGKSYYPVLLVSSVIVLLVLFSWFYFRNILAGIIFKMQYRPRRGRQLTFENYSGAIKEAGSTYLTLETNAGDELKVPYSHLFGPLSESAFQKSRGESIIKLRVSKNQGKDVWVQKIRWKVLNTPWSTFRKEPVIKLISEGEDFYEFEIGMNIIHPRHLPQIEKSLKESVLG